MKYKSRVALFLIFSAFVTTFCRCAFDSGTPVTLNLSDGSTLECREFYESNPTWETVFYYYSYDCNLPCPDAGSVSLKEIRLPNIEGKYNGADIVDLDLATLQAQYCAAATPTPTPTPLSEDPSGAVKVSTPLLTEKITACDYKKGFVNFELADPASEFDQVNVSILLNDTSVNCSVPNNNKDILNCELPPGVRFPIHVLVDVDQSRANDFIFDGSFCGYKDPSAPNDGGEQPSQPGQPAVQPTATDFGG